MRLAALMVCVALVAGACSGTRDGAGSRPDLTGSRAVTFSSSDGVKLAGRLFPAEGGAEHPGVVLAHMLPADQSSWYAFAGRLAGEGFTALTFDFRGYCPGGDAGCSKGSKDVASIWQDVAGAASFLRTQPVSSVSLVGASMGGTADLIAAGGASPPAGDVLAVITLSAPVSIEGLSATPELMLSIQAGKLFVAALGDGVAADAAQQLYDEASPPKRVEILPVDGHGSDLLTGPRGEEAQRLILTTLAQYTQPRPTP